MSREKTQAEIDSIREGKRKALIEIEDMYRLRLIPVADYVRLKEALNDITHRLLIVEDRYK